MAKTSRTVFIEDIVGSKIVTADGKRIGRVTELLSTQDGSHEVIGLVYGRSAWLYRLHVLEPLAEKFGYGLEPHIVPWDAVDRFENFVVVLKAGSEKQAREGRISYERARFSHADESNMDDQQ